MAKDIRLWEPFEKSFTKRLAIPDDRGSSGTLFLKEKPARKRTSVGVRKSARGY